jgi:hypothetical protein
MIEPAMMTKHRMRTVTWIAMFAIIATILAPVATRTMPTWSGANSPWDEICTSLGLKTLSAESTQRSSDLPGPPAGKAHLSDCPDCLPSVSPAALPSQPARVPRSVEHETSRLLFFFISAPRSTPLPASIQPRAPPQFA